MLIAAQDAESGAKLSEDELQSVSNGTTKRIVSHRKQETMIKIGPRYRRFRLKVTLSNRLELMRCVFAMIFLTKKTA